MSVEVGEWSSAVRKRSRNLSPVVRPVGIRAQLEGTSVSEYWVTALNTGERA